MEEIPRFQRNGTFLILRRINDARTNGIWESIEVEKKLILSVLNSIRRSLPELIVDIIDQNNFPIVSQKIRIALPFYFGTNFLRLDQEITEHQLSNTGNMLIVYPVLNALSTVDPYTGTGDSEYRNSYNIIWPGKSAIEISMEFDVSPDEMKQMRNVKCTIQ